MILKILNLIIYQVRDKRPVVGYRIKVWSSR